MLHYFVGEDVFGARQAIGRLAQEKKSLVRWLDRQELTEKPLGEWVDQAAGGLFATEVLVVRDPSALPKHLQEDVIKLTSRQVPAVCVAWDRIAPDRRSTLYRSLKPYLKEFAPLTPRDLINWLVEEAQRRQTNLVPPAAGELVNRVGPNRWQLLNELEKLSLTNKKKEIGVAAVVAGVPPAQTEPEIFVLLDAIAAGKIQPALLAMEVILQSGASELYILSMLAYQFRTLLNIKNGLRRGLAGDQIAQEAKLHPYVVKKNSPAAGKYSAATLLSYLTRIMATDFAIKQGKVDPRTGLVMTVVGLARQ